MALDYTKTKEEWAKNDAIRDAGLTTPDDIERFDNLKYGELDYWNELDIYRPKGNKEVLPVIISIHGGGWFYGDKNLYQHYCMRLAQRGFAVVNFTYRLAPEFKYPAPLEDTAKVFDFIVENAEKYKLDLNNVFTVGDSAGGQLNHQLNIILTNPEYAKLFDFKFNEKVKVRACALNCGVYSMPVSKLFGPLSMMKVYLPDNWKDYYETFKFNRYLTKDFTPAFIMTAHNDFLKIFAKPLYKKFIRKGIDCMYGYYGYKDYPEDVNHVFHVNCKTEIAKICNDDECNFFREHLV